jgi:hypothetical protein
VRAVVVWEMLHFNRGEFVAQLPLVVGLRGDKVFNYDIRVVVLPPV